MKNSITRYVRGSMRQDFAGPACSILDSILFTDGQGV